jgi:SAM-dependent methyltransferase
MNQYWNRYGVLLPVLLLLGLRMPAQHPSPPPYQCGFVLESEAAIRKVYAPELEALKLQSGQVIADVGGSNGYRMAMFAVLYDSLTFYIEDIDTLCLNADEFQKVHAYYSKVKGSPLNCEFHLVPGTEQATMLPNGIFDKVLVTASYHHFSDPAGMLADIVTKLKPDGRIYLIENVVRKAGKRRKRLCNDPLKTAEGLRWEFEEQGFKVEAMHSLGRWWTKMFVLKKPANR